MAVFAFFQAEVGEILAYIFLHIIERLRNIRG